MAPQKTTVDYSKYPSEELLQFVQRRDLGNHFRNQIINFLQDADQVMKFRFLDLPPEIRIMVYEMVFEVERDWNVHFRSIKPELAILSTCKQLHREAFKIANRKASFPLRLVASAEHYKSVAYANGDELLIPREPYFEFSHWLIPKVTAMNLEIYIDKEFAPARENAALNHGLERLLDYVKNRSKLRYLRIHINSRLRLDHTNNRLLVSILFALPAFSSTVEKAEFEFTNVPAMTQLCFLETAKAFKALRSMEPELKEVLKVRKQLQAYTFWSDGTLDQFMKLFLPNAINAWRLFAREQELKAAINELETLFKDTWERDTDGKLREEWEWRKKLLALADSEA